MRILYVEDDRDVANAILRMFRLDENTEYNVTHVTNASDAIAEVTGSDFDCILTDYRLGKQTTADDLVQHIKRYRPEYVLARRVIVLSANPHALEALAKVGCRTLQKPCGADRIFAEVRACLG